VKQKKMTTHTDGLKKALAILDRFSPKELYAETGAKNALSDQLLQRLNFLLDDRRNMISRLERMEKELAVFRNVNAEASRMLEKKIEELSLLRLITDTTGRAIMAHDPFKPILDKVITIVGADAGLLCILNPESGRFELQTASAAGLSYPEDILVQIMEDVAGRIAPEAIPLLVDDLRADARFSDLFSRPETLRSFASFPLVVEHKSIGILIVANQHANAFDAETDRIMHIIAGQIGVTVQNALLYAEVKKTKEYLENLVERAGDAIFTLDRSHMIVSWNNGAQTIFRRDKKSAIGRSLSDVISADSASLLKQHIESIMNSENIVTTEIDVAGDNGKAAQIALTLSPIRGADGEVIGVSGIAKDISEQKRVEEELRRLNDAKSQFVSTVSHELRTPLTSIKSYVEILLHEMNALPEDTIFRYLTIMNEECDRLSTLITNVLDLQKLEAGRLQARLEPLLFADVVRVARELFHGVAVPNRIELSSEFIVPDHMTRVRGDRKRLMQVLSNLLSNAFKFAKVGGHVGICLNKDEEGVHLVVTDDGIGIPASETEKVFEKFYQVDNEITRTKGGTGLGLSITRDLIQLHGGRIWVESKEGEGCAFHVVLPPDE